MELTTDNKMARALQIARTYRDSHSGKLPVLVVTDALIKSEQVVVGKFRKKFEYEDQRDFCAMLRMDFARRGIDSYMLVTKPESGIPVAESEDALAVLYVSGWERRAEFYSVPKAGSANSEAVRLMGANNVRGLFSQLLPTASDKEWIQKLSPKGLATMDRSLNACIFSMPETVAPIEFGKVTTIEDGMKEDMFDVLVKAFA